MELSPGAAIVIVFEKDNKEQQFIFLIVACQLK
jgi:hypothetical protein